MTPAGQSSSAEQARPLPPVAPWSTAPTPPNRGFVHHAMNAMAACACLSTPHWAQEALPAFLGADFDDGATTRRPARLHKTEHYAAAERTCPA
jgi:hypothetical protein